jgi:hypothetical protein
VNRTCQRLTGSSPKMDNATYDSATDVYVIYVVKYSGELFRQFAQAMPIGAPFRIVKRESGKTARKFRSDCEPVAVSI